VLSFPAPKSLVTILSYRERSDGVIPRKSDIPELLLAHSPNP